MKHILNNISEEEKNAIREQHTGGMKLNTEKFKQLLETKQGDVKPLVSEQSYSPLGDVMTGSSHKAVKAVFDSCRNVPQSPININKLVDGIYKGVQGLGTDEGLILRSLSHIKDLNTFCTAAKNYKTTYGVDLYTDLDDDIDEESVWSQISRILRNLKPAAVATPTTTNPTFGAKPTTGAKPTNPTFGAKPTAAPTKPTTGAKPTAVPTKQPKFTSK
jgi:hypothetical protein